MLTYSLSITYVYITNFCSCQNPQIESAENKQHLFDPLLLLVLLLLLLLLLYAVTHAPFHAPVLRPTSWPNARDRRDGEVN